MITPEAMTVLLEHNALFRNDMTFEEVSDWIDKHVDLMSKYNLLTGEKLEDSNSSSV